MHFSPSLGRELVTRRLSFLALVLISLIAVDAKADIFPANDTRIVTMGRVDWTLPDQPAFYWPSTGFQVKFTGTTLKAQITELGNNHLYVIVDEEEPVKIEIPGGSGTSTLLTLASGLDAGEHEVRVIKVTELHGWNCNGFRLSEIQTDTGETLLQATALPEKKIEFYGDSITAGLGIDHPSDPNAQAPEYTNNYKTYAAVTARTLDADYRVAAVSGIGISKGFTEDFNMPDIWDDVNFDHRDSIKYEGFAGWQPDLVVVNLMQNDSSTGAAASFGDAVVKSTYKSFIQSLRAVYPDADILCILGGMNAVNSSYPSYIQSVVSDLNDEGDNHVYAYILPYINENHPTAAQNERMADLLVHQIYTHSYGGFEGEAGNVDQLGDIVFPTEVEAGSTLEIHVPYEVSDTRTLNLVLLDTVSWNTHALETVQLDPGSGTHAFTISIGSGTPAHANYVWKAEILPVGADYTNFLDKTVTGTTVTPEAVDELGTVQFPTEVIRGGSYTIHVPYEVSDARTMNLVLLDSDNWASYAEETVQLEAGTGVHSFTITINPSAPIHNRFVWKVEILPLGGDYTEFLDKVVVQNVSVSETSVVDVDNDGMDDQWESVHSAFEATSDPDGDGLNNLLEYVLGSNPHLSDASEHLRTDCIQEEGAFLSLTFTRRTNLVGLVRTIVEASSNCFSEAWSEISQISNQVDNGNGTETLTVVDTTPITSNSMRFMRLRVVTE